MRAGALGRTVTIEAYVPGAPDDYGVSQAGWSSLATIRAQLVSISTEEFLRSSGEGSDAVLVFRVRYLPGITTLHRLTFEGRAYDIRELKEIGRREGLELRCEKVRA